MTTYATRSNARRAAQAACRRSLKAPHYQAAEGPDYIIHPQSPTLEDMTAGCFQTRYSFELRGPAADERETKP